MSELLNSELLKVNEIPPYVQLQTSKQRKRLEILGSFVLLIRING